MLTLGIILSFIGRLVTIQQYAEIDQMSLREPDLNRLIAQFEVDQRSIGKVAGLLCKPSELFDNVRSCD